MNNFIGFDGDFKEFLNMFRHDDIAYGPVYRYYRELEELKVKRNREVDKEFFVVKYEDLQNNFEDVVTSLCMFLGREPLNEWEMKKLKEHCSFTEMKLNPSVNYDHWDDLGVRKKGESKFMRKGVVGDWKLHFNQEEQEKFDVWFNFKTNALNPVDEVDVKLNLV